MNENKAAKLWDLQHKAKTIPAMVSMHHVSEAWVTFQLRLKPLRGRESRNSEDVTLTNKNVTNPNFPVSEWELVVCSFCFSFKIKHLCCICSCHNIPNSFSSYFFQYCQILCSEPVFFCSCRKDSWLWRNSPHRSPYRLSRNERISREKRTTCSSCCRRWADRLHADITQTFDFYSTDDVLTFNRREKNWCHWKESTQSCLRGRRSLTSL